MKRITATARVRLTLEIPAGQSWASGCDMAQIHKQAVEAVMKRLQYDNQIAMLFSAGHARILDSKVTAIFAESDE